MIVARALAAAVFAASLLTAGAASAQTYPTRPVTLIVAFPPGGADDATARILQDAFQKALGQPLVIENIGGAGGMIAAAKAARAEPDGYTILLHQDALAAGMALYPNRTFDAEKDFVPIGLVNITANTIAGRPTLPPNNFAELLRWMKEPGQSIKIGHPGVGSFGHLAEVLIFHELGIKVTQVPYRGAGPALVDLLAGQVDLGPISGVVARPLVESGKLKAYAVVGKKRFAGLPNLPTMGELGYKKLDVDFWHMLLAPAGTPRPIVEKLNAALRTALKDPKVRKTYGDGGLDFYPDSEETPEAAAALLKSEIKLWGDVVRENNIAAQ
ncbi:MAG TPA: tripartite tricarboxylate transporter substrate binding protein [Xanthobacteraceae bacterium]|jgi:tripartite-type tricarboxylate transporter receptor subunit TctC|nr:tripartite tricarboxylate transporter substrate binding protein [Xanthobacteraceae bacterium]